MKNFIPQKKISKTDIKIAIGYASIFASRMLGLFMILPIFSIYVEKHYTNITPALIGIAIGIYGFTQALFQIPFGFLSDKFGRKKIIFIGLCLFALGSLFAAKATSIYQIIFGRMLQGAGAIGSTILAAVSDSTQKTSQHKVMGIIGATIGVSFVFSFILGPIIAKHAGLSGIFYITFFLSLIAIIILFYLPDKPLNKDEQESSNIEIKLFSEILLNNNLIKYNAGIFVLHASLTSLFLVIPKFLNHFSFIEHNLSLTYFAMFFLAMILVFPFLSYADKSKNIYKLQAYVFVIMIISELIMLLFKFNLILLIISLILFFVCFNFLESSFPASVSKLTSKEAKGTSLGIYSSFQFLGIFMGGTLGGIINQKLGFTAVISFAIILAFCWILFSSLMDYAMLRYKQKII